MDATQSRIEYCNSYDNNRNACFKACGGSEFRKYSCACLLDGCELCITKPCHKCKSAYTYFASISAGVRNVTCKYSFTCNGVNGFIHENPSSLKKGHCTNGACDIGFKLNPTKSKCIPCSEGVGSCRDGEPAVEIVGPN